jgi:hypothetical protein
MDPTIRIDKRVKVIAIYYSDRSVDFICCPYIMFYNNEEIRFKRLCLRHPTSRGKRMIHVFDMTDDVNDYRLEFDAEGLTWTLVAIIEGGKKSEI